jgi:hypothetical protein
MVVSSGAVALAATMALAASPPKGPPAYTAHLPIVLDLGTQPAPPPSTPPVVPTVTPSPTLTADPPPPPGTPSPTIDATPTPLPRDTVVIIRGGVVMRPGYPYGVFVGELVNTTNGSVSIDECYGEFRFWDFPVVTKRGYVGSTYLRSEQRTAFWIENPFYDHARDELFVQWHAVK